MCPLVSSSVSTGGTGTTSTSTRPSSGADFSSGKSQSAYERTASNSSLNVPAAASLSASATASAVSTRTAAIVHQFGMNQHEHSRRIQPLDNRAIPERHHFIGMFPAVDRLAYPIPRPVFDLLQPE